MDIAMKLHEHGRDEDMTVFFLLAWGFWFRRNKFVNEQTIVEPRQVADHALSLKHEFTAIQKASGTDLKIFYN